MPLKSKLISRAAGVLFASIAAVVGLHEGRSLVSYQDSAGVWTICDGETLGVKPGQRRSEAQCDETLRKGIARHAEALTGLPEGLPDVVLLGSVDLVYNIGVYGFRSSSAYKALAQQDYTAAGAAVLRWKYITLPNGKRFDCSTPGNTVCYGLWKRRLWQAKAIGNEFPSVQAALAALPK